MTDDRDDSDEKPVGYCSPPKHHQFKAGEPSPNPRGRPRKAERSYTSRQVRHDLLEVMEEPVSVNIGGRTKRLPMIVAAYRKLMLEALKGDAKLLLEVVKLRATLIHEHKIQNWDEISNLERLEKLYATDEAVAAQPQNFGHMNKVRKRTRKL